MSYASLVGLPDNDVPAWWRASRCELDMDHEPVGQLDEIVASFGEIYPDDASDGDVLVLIYPGAFVEWLPETRDMYDRDGRSINRCGATPCETCELMRAALGAGFTLDEVLTHVG